MTGLRFPPFVRPGAATSARAAARDELPSIDEFIDELPPIENFLADFAQSEGEVDAGADYADAIRTPAEALPPINAEGWARGDWQSYDWGSLASLNRQNPGRSTADESWGDSDWPGEEMNSSAIDSSVTPGAAEIADALDGIARRIRSGELVLDNLHGTRPEAAMAAALAVLFRMRG